VTTKDGYVLQLQRLPRARCRDVVFYVHGVMDTALAWVGTSVTEALAFSSWEAGYDVWLASCRSNPPRTHTHSSHRGAKYFSYTVNELACLDLSAQVGHFLPCCALCVASCSISSRIDWLPCTVLTSINDFMILSQVLVTDPLWSCTWCNSSLNIAFEYLAKDLFCMGLG
jgi:hypothetical protein